MKGRQASVRRLAFAVRLGALLLGTLSLPQCSAPEAIDGDESHLGSATSYLEHCGGVACTGNADCQLNPPLCAATNSGVCLMTTPRECAWSLAISATCLCLEHDIRLCTPQRWHARRSSLHGEQASHRHLLGRLSGLPQLLTIALRRTELAARS